MRSLCAVVASLIMSMLVTIAAMPVRSDQPQTRLRLFDLTTAHGVLDNRPFRPTQVFGPGDNPIYVWFRGEGCIIGTTITSSWYYLETDPPLKFAEGEVTIDRPDERGQFNFESAPGRRWSLGEYRVELTAVNHFLHDERRFEPQPFHEFGERLSRPGSGTRRGIPSRSSSSCSALFSSFN